MLFNLIHLKKKDTFQTVEKYPSFWVKLFKISWFGKTFLFFFQGKNKMWWPNCEKRKKEVCIFFKKQKVFLKFFFSFILFDQKFFGQFTVPALLASFPYLLQAFQKGAEMLCHHIRSASTTRRSSFKGGEACRLPSQK